MPGAFYTSGGDSSVVEGTTAGALRAVLGGDSSSEGVISYGSTPSSILEVTESDPTGQSVTVSPGWAIVQDADGDPYAVEITVETVLDAPAGAGGGSDIVYITSEGTLHYTIDATVPTNGLLLATVSTASGAATVNADITDERVWL